MPGALDHSLQFIMDCNDAKANLDPKKDNFFAVTWVLLIHFAKRIVGFAKHIYKRCWVRTRNDTTWKRCNPEGHNLERQGLEDT